LNTTKLILQVPKEKKSAYNKKHPGNYRKRILPYQSMLSSGWQSEQLLYSVLLSATRS